MEGIKIKAFLFDLDGTLWDSENAICRSLQSTISAETGISLDKRSIRKELRLCGSPMKVLKKYGIQNLNAYWKKYRENLGEICLFFENTHSVFNKLKHHRKLIGYVTSLKKEFAVSLLCQYSLDKYAKVLITPSECRVSKPNPHSILMATKALSVIENEAIYIGDQATDIQAAKRAGCKSGFASWGGLTIDTDQPDFIFRELRDLTAFL